VTGCGGGTGIIGRLIVATLPLYFTWEMLQGSAFTGMPKSWLAATAMCAQATLGDAAIVLALFALSAGLFRDVRWFAPVRAGRYGVVVLAALVIHVGVERVMLGLGRWGYAAGHPVIPMLKVGVLVIFQPMVLVPLVFGVLAAWEGRRECARAR